MATTGDIRITIDGLDTMVALVTGLHGKLDELKVSMAATQDDIDALTAKVGAIGDRWAAAVTDIRGDIADLKTAGVNVASLEANVNRLGQLADDAAELAAENPPAAP